MNKLKKPSNNYDDDEFPRSHLRPHLYYLLLCLTVKWLFGSVLKAIAIQGVSLVNFWYPLIATVSCVHELRHPKHPNAKREQQARQIIDRKLSDDDDDDDDDDDVITTNKDTSAASAGCHYWFQYWSIYALVQTVDQILSLLIVVSRTRNQLMAEAQLFFSLYLLIVKSDDSPLEKCYNWVTPKVIECHLKLTDAIPEQTWTRLVTSKMEQLLELMVTVHLIQRPWKQKATIVLRELRPLVVPAVATFLPVTPILFIRLGVIYAQYLLPTGKASIALKKNQSRELHYLQYWILHATFSILFEGISIFWWLPFYDHSMFVFWAFLTFDGTISEYYNVLEIDLISLGILHGDSKVELHQTQTVQFLTAIAKRLPSADEAAWDALLLKDTTNHTPEEASSFPTDTNTSNLRKHDHDNDSRAVAQLKSLIRQLPVNDKDLNLPDEKTTKLLEMLIHQLSREEEKMAVQLEKRVADAVKEKVDKTRNQDTISNADSIQDTPGQWVDIAMSGSLEADDVDTHKAMGIGKQSSEDDASVEMDADEFYDAEHDNTISSNSAASDVGSDEQFSLTRTASSEAVILRTQTPDPRDDSPVIVIDEPSAATADEEGHFLGDRNEIMMVNEERDNTILTSRSTLSSFVGENSSSENFYDAKMPERRTKRERISPSKASSNSSFVSKLMGRMELNHKARRKEKRVKALEKKRGKEKKNS